MKRILFFIVVIASLVIINNLIHSIYNLSQKKDLITKTQDQLQQAREENAKLKKLLSTSGTTQFVEKEARDKLQMVKPGEEIVIVPSVTPEPAGTNTGQGRRPYWQQWLNLFF